MKLKPTIQQYNNKTIGIILGCLMLVGAVVFNLWTYKLEPTAKLDPNDNTFQFALVYRTNQIWDFANKTCPKNLSFVICHLSFLSDHWVPNWAQGYNLPYYYSHIPQITIVTSHRLFSLLDTRLSLFSYYHYVIYLLLCLFPLSLFLALRIIGLSWITAGIGALIASQLSTDGLYGLDPASFLFRGYGLSSQLFSMIWLPLTFAFAYKYFQSTETRIFKLVSASIPVILTLTATTAGHLGIGIIAFISIAIMALSPILLYALTNPQKIIILLYCSIAKKTNKIRQQYNNSTIHQLKSTFWKLFILYGGVLLLLGYWIIPILLEGNYHNISVWDPIWKFDSYGYREVLKNLFNGDLFDFGRFPILTLLTAIGIFSAVSGKMSTTANEDNENNNYFGFAALFFFWLLFYFGRTTWGGLVNLIPGMEEFHLSRFIVGLHITGLFLIPIGLEWLVTKFSKHVIIRLFAYLFICLFVYLTVSPQTLRYSSHNDTLIKQANDTFNKIEADTDSLLSTLEARLSSTPGRVYFGRGGTWGKSFQVAETPMFIYMSTFGIPTLTWLPETWSPNSDTEQYFSEDVSAHYILYNIKYVVTPIDLPKDKIQAFWKPLKETKSWILYEVSLSVPSEVEGSTGILRQAQDSQNTNFGYITTGIRPAVVSTSKRNFTNVIRLWIQSDTHTKNLYPELTFNKDYPKNYGLPNFRMIDEVTYQIPDLPAGRQEDTTHNLFAEVPRYEAPIPNPEPQGSKLDTRISNLKTTSQSNDNDMIFKATVTVPEKCTECLVILRQTYHPSWRATVDGKPVNTFSVFPFYTAVKLENAGTHEIVFSYQPSLFKQFSLIIALITLGCIFYLARLQAGPNTLHKIKSQP